MSSLVCTVFQESTMEAPAGVKSNRVMEVMQVIACFGLQYIHFVEVQSHVLPFSKGCTVFTQVPLNLETIGWLLR